MGHNTKDSKYIDLGNLPIRSKRTKSGSVEPPLKSLRSESNYFGFFFVP